MHEADGQQTLDAAAVRRWYQDTLTTFARHRRIVDELNVFPVPDGDTGTNMAQTMRAACEALDEGEATSIPQITHRAARGALLGARGNSGVILAQMLRGLADAWTSDTVNSKALAAGLRQAFTGAVEAVAAPAEGTILTVARAAAAAAHDNSDEPIAVAASAVSRAAATALVATVDQLPALARAGVVDAGGLGLALMLDALAHTAGGQANGEALRAAGSEARTARARIDTEVPRESGSADYAYEVQYLLDADPDSVDRLRQILSGLGDSLAVVGTASEPADDAAPTWNVHIHVNDVGAAVEAGINCGRLYRLAVTRFADHGHGSVHRIPGLSTPQTPRANGNRGFVVVADAPGLAEVILGEGGRPVSGPQPSMEEILSASRATGCLDVIVLVDQQCYETAERAANRARTDGLRMSVIPTRSPVQALAALAVRDESRRFDDDVIAMAEAAGSCRYAEVTVATRAALTSVGRCEQGDFLGLADGDVVLIGRDLDALLADLVDRMCAAGTELVTIVSGAELAQAGIDLLTTHLARRWPLVEVQSFKGGQPRHLIWIGSE